MVTPENFVRSLLERAIEDELVAPPDTTLAIEDDDLSYLRTRPDEDFVGVVHMLERYVDGVVAELAAVRK